MSVTVASPEDRFLRYARERDAAELDALLQEYVGRCYAQARRITGRDHLAEEAVQEACLKLIATAGRYDGSVPFAAWLGKLVANAAIDQLRGTRRRARHERASAREPVAAEPTASDDERFDHLRTALDELPERYRRALIIHYIAGLDHRQTAKALGVPTGTFAARISRGKDRLRARMARIGSTTGAVTLIDLAASPVAAAPQSLGPSVSAMTAQAVPTTIGVGAVVAAHPLVAAALAILIAGASIPAALVALRSQSQSASDSGYASSSTAPVEVVVRSGDDLQAAIDAHPPGTAFRLGAGIHRLQSAVPKDRDVFTGEHGAVMSGARELTGFHREGDLWCIDGQVQQGQVHGVAGDGRPRAIHPEDLYFD
nr:sigma-70 family RNA polymerase sigma factor [Planctomycetota bacterium]